MAARALLRVKVEDLHPDAAQPRQQFDGGALEGLAHSLREHGQLQPVLVVERAGKLVLLDGERRWRAAKLAGLDTLEVLVVPAEGPEALERALVANVQREDLNPIEKARALARLIEGTERTAAQVAAALGLSAPTVSRLLALLALPEEIQARVVRGEIPASTAYEIARCGNASQQAGLAAEASDKKLTRATVARQRRASARKPGRAKSKTARLVAALGGGRTLTFGGSGWGSLPELATWLEDLAGRARAAAPGGLTLAAFVGALRAQARTTATHDAPASRGGAS